MAYSIATESSCQPFVVGSLLKLRSDFDRVSSTICMKLKLYNKNIIVKECNGLSDNGQQEVVWKTVTN